MTAPIPWSDAYPPITWNTIEINWNTPAYTDDLLFASDLEYALEFDATVHTWEGVALYDAGIGYTSRTPVNMRALAPFSSDINFTSKATYNVPFTASFDAEYDFSSRGNFTRLAEGFFALGASMNADQEFMWNSAPGTNATNWDEQADKDTVWSEKEDATSTWNKVDYPN